MTMLSKNQRKLIASMAQKKYRDLHGLFLAEGPKTVSDLIDGGIHPRLIVISNERPAPDAVKASGCETITVSASQFESISHQKSPQQLLALFEKPKHTINNNAIHKELALVLDGVQDPGNLGTIIRAADWFGIHTIICSNDSADVYNPKVVQATMGAIARVKVAYTELPEYLLHYREQSTNPIYGTFLDGGNIYQQTLSQAALIVMGNEGNGIRDSVAEVVSHKITIPSYTKGLPGSESLNVGLATAIVCSEFRRRIS